MYYKLKVEFKVLFLLVLDLHLLMCMIIDNVFFSSLCSFLIAASAWKPRHKQTQVCSQIVLPVSCQSVTTAILCQCSGGACVGAVDQCNSSVTCAISNSSCYDFN